MARPPAFTCPLNVPLTLIAYVNVAGLMLPHVTTREQALATLPPLVRARPYIFMTNARGRRT
jgi:hypothetical protein